MEIPTDKVLLKSIKEGKACEGIIPVAADADLAECKIVKFREATFSPFGVATLVTNGASVDAFVTKAEDTHESFRGFKLFSIKWATSAVFDMSNTAGQRPDFSSAPTRCPFRKSTASSNRYRARTYDSEAGDGLTKRTSSRVNPDPASFNQPAPAGEYPRPSYTTERRDKKDAL